MSEAISAEEHNAPTGQPGGSPPAWLGRAAAAATLVVATAAAVGLMLQTRRDWALGAYNWRALTRAGYDLWAVGLVLQGLILPMALVALAARTRPFRDVALGRGSRRDIWWLVATLAVIQLASLQLSIISENDVGLYVIVVIVAGLLGGWPSGLALGVVAYSMVHVYAFAQWRLEGPAPAAVHLTDPASLRAVAVEFLDSVSPAEFTPFIWSGLAASSMGDLLGDRRFRPLMGFFLGSGISLVATALAAGYWEDPSDIVNELFVPLVLLTGLAVAALAYLVQGIRSEEVGRRAEAAESARVRAELKALRAQINPHFLFNSLNTIRYFVRKDPATARRLLIDLSAVYQRALRAGDFVPLAEEISHVEAYLELEKARLGKRLAVTWTAPRGEALRVPVPTLILQPIVENAVIHGIGPKAAGGHVGVAIQEADGLLTMEVTDDGAGIAPERLAALLSQGEARGESIGLINVDGRLRSLYGEEYGLAIESSPGVGTTVRFRVPVAAAKIPEGGPSGQGSSEQP
ncbi:MAG: sensor histidine kinase [Anaerolineae bacterium]